MTLRGAQTGSGEQGQATVEAALTLPVVLIALLLIVQVGIVVRDALALAQAAREGARAAAVTARDEDAREAIERSAGPLAADRIDADISPPEDERVRGDVVFVRLSYIERLSIPIVSRMVSLDLPLRATAAMRLEQSHPTPTPKTTPTPEPTPTTPTPPPATATPEPEPPTPDPTPTVPPSVDPSPSPMAEPTPSAT